jgi:hypothetical protein
MMPPNVQAAKYVPEKSSIFFSADGTPGVDFDLVAILVVIVLLSSEGCRGPRYQWLLQAMRLRNRRETDDYEDVKR